MVRRPRLPTMKDHGRCSLPNVRSPAPPLPAAYAQGVWVFMVFLKVFMALFETFTGTHTYAKSYSVAAHFHTWKKTNKPGSWRSWARCPQRPPLAAKDPTGPQLSISLSFGEGRVKCYITYILALHVFHFPCLCFFHLCERWALIYTSVSNVWACRHTVKIDFFNQ